MSKSLEMNLVATSSLSFDSRENLRNAENGGSRLRTFGSYLVYEWVFESRMCREWYPEYLIAAEIHPFPSMVCQLLSQHRLAPYGFMWKAFRLQSITTESIC